MSRFGIGDGLLCSHNISGTAAAVAVRFRTIFICILGYVFYFCEKY